MGKSGDNNDKTQALSESQVVEVRPSRPKPTHAKSTKTPAFAPQGDKNDRSVWKGLVVGADEFAPPRPPPRSRTRWLVVGILGAAAIGGGAYFLWPKQSAAPPTPDAAAKKPDAAPTPDARPDAQPIDAAVDAAPADAPSDAASADAGVDAGVKPKPIIKKKGVIKKRPVKKKLGAATSR